MKKGLLSIFICAGIIFSCLGCRTLEKAVVPVNDRVLVYEDLTFDLTYLRTLEALQKDPDWDLMTTEKEKGTIGVYNKVFKTAVGKENRMITFQLKMLPEGGTSIQIAPADQHVPGGDKLLDLIAQTLDKE